jgi:tripartite-type tricarboxylate transporter receptor subunit TctC
VLVDALHASMADPAVQQALDDIGLDAVTDTPETFRQAIATDHAKWTALIRKIKPAVD